MRIRFTTYRASDVAFAGRSAYPVCGRCSLKSDDWLDVAIVLGIVALVFLGFWWL